ncbi:MAG TPA: PAS domain-containing protein, partial [Balneolales bacterium]|nr:PAS domain-containing protein [Balneolales bacterium]
MNTTLQAANPQLLSEFTRFILDEVSTEIYCIELDSGPDISHENHKIIKQITHSDQIHRIITNSLDGTLDLLNRVPVNEPADEFFSRVLGNPEEVLSQFIDYGLYYHNILSFTDGAKSPYKYKSITIHGVLRGSELGRIWLRAGSFSPTEQTNQRINAFQALIEHVPDLIYFKNDKHQFVLVNREKARDHGVEPQDMIGKTDRDFFCEEIAEQCLNDDEKVLRTGKPIILKEERLLEKDGREKWVSVTK